MDVIEKLDLLKDDAADIGAILQGRVKNPQDALIVIAMISAFIIETQRTKGTPTQVALETFVKIVSALVGVADGIAEKAQ